MYLSLDEKSAWEQSEIKTKFIWKTWYSKIIIKDSELDGFVSADIPEVDASHIPG